MGRWGGKSYGLWLGTHGDPGVSPRSPAANGDYSKAEQRGRRVCAGRARGCGSHLPAESRFSGMPPSGHPLPDPAVQEPPAPCATAWGCPLPRVQGCHGAGQCQAGLGVAAGEWPLLWRPPRSQEERSPGRRGLTHEKGPESQAPVFLVEPHTWSDACGKR